MSTHSYSRLWIHLIREIIPLTDQIPRDFSPGRINFNLTRTPLPIFTRLRTDLEWYLSTWVRKRVNGSVMACWLG